MKQKELTEGQKFCLEMLNAALKVCKQSGIGFVYDTNDCSVSAFNAENLADLYGGRDREDEADALMDWDLVEAVSTEMDFFDSGMQNYYLKFKES